MNLYVLYGLLLGLLGLSVGVFVYAVHAKQWRKALKETEEELRKIAD